MLVLGVTGSLGTGKTTVAGMFKDLGAFVVDADEIARRLMEPRTAAWKKIKTAFGEKVIGAGGRIDRKALSLIVFKDKRKLDRLCGIIHPLVYKEFEENIKKIRKRNPEAVIVLDAPLLLESKGKPKIDKLIVVRCGCKRQLRRAIKRTRLTRAEIMRRIKAQMPLKEKVKAADFIIANDGGLSSTKRQVTGIWKNLGKG